MNTNGTVTHSLNCDDQPLPKGMRRERNWSCTCGQKFFGYDGAVRKEFSAHKKG